MNQGILHKIGLTEGETKVYLGLLKLGQTTTGPLVKEAGVSTSKSYKILARLEQKGLASYVYKNKVKYFKAAPPEKILDLVNQQLEELEESKNKIKSTIEELIKYQHEVQDEHEAEVYYGIEGVETLFGEQTHRLKKGESHYVIGITHMDDYGSKIANYFRRLQAKRDNKGLISNFLLGENAKDSFDYMNTSKLCNVRYLPYASLVAINIYKDVTIIGVFVGQPILIKITSQIVADNFIKYFEMLWKQAKS